MTRPGPAPREGGVNGAKAVVLLVVLVVLAIVVLSRVNGHNAVASKSSVHQTTSTTHPASTAPSTTAPPTTALPASQVKVQVLNGVLTGSLAGQWTTKLKNNPGYQTLTPDNATAKVNSSIIYVLTPGYTAEGQALAAAVGLPSTAVSTTVPANAPIPASERASANLVLIVGPDLAGAT